MCLFLFSCLKGKFTGREIFHPLILSATAAMSSQAKIGSLESHQVSYLSDRDPSAGADFCCFPRSISNGLEVEQLRFKLALMCEAGIMNGTLTPKSQTHSHMSEKLRIYPRMGQVLYIKRNQLEAVTMKYAIASTGRILKIASEND